MYNVQHWVTRFFFRSEIIFRTTQELEYLFYFFVFLGVHILILSDFFIGMLHVVHIFYILSQLHVQTCRCLM